MSKDLNDTLEQLAVARGVSVQGTGAFFKVLDMLQNLERELSATVNGPLSHDDTVFDPALPGMMRRQAD